MDNIYSISAHGNILPSKLRIPVGYNFVTFVSPGNVYLSCISYILSIIGKKIIAKDPETIQLLEDMLNPTKSILATAKFKDFAQKYTDIDPDKFPIEIRAHKALPHTETFMHDIKLNFLAWFNEEINVSVCGKEFSYCGFTPGIAHITEFSNIYTNIEYERNLATEPYKTLEFADDNLARQAINELFCSYKYTQKYPYLSEQAQYNPVRARIIKNKRKQQRDQLLPDPCYPAANADLLYFFDERYQKSTEQTLTYEDIFTVNLSELIYNYLDKFPSPTPVVYFLTTCRVCDEEFEIPILRYSSDELYKSYMKRQLSSEKKDPEIYLIDTIDGATYCFDTLEKLVSSWYLNYDNLDSSTIRVGNKSNIDKCISLQKS